MATPDNPNPNRDPIEVVTPQFFEFTFFSHPRSRFVNQCTLRWNRSTETFETDSIKFRSVLLHLMTIYSYWYESGRPGEDQPDLRDKFWARLPGCRKQDYKRVGGGDIPPNTRDKLYRKICDKINALTKEAAKLGVWTQQSEFTAADTSGAHHANQRQENVRTAREYRRQVNTPAWDGIFDTSTGLILGDTDLRVAIRQSLFERAATRDYFEGLLGWMERLYARAALRQFAAEAYIEDIAADGEGVANDEDNAGDLTWLDHL